MDLKKILFLSVNVFLLMFSPKAQALQFEGSEFIFSGPSSEAVEAAKWTYRQGGNIADIAVAAGFTLAVTKPIFAALGAGGFALVKIKDEVEVI